MLKKLMCLIGFHHWIITDERISSHDDEYYEFSKTVTCTRCSRFSVKCELVPKE